MSERESLSSSRASCEKCGSEDVLTRWHGDGSYHVSRRHQECHGDYGATRGKPKNEHLHYHCRNCQFSWTGPLTPRPRNPPVPVESLFDEDDLAIMEMDRND